MKYIFGPVPSRRLGSSLGIDIVPAKTCNLDCIYCEVGRTNKLTNKRDSYINIEEMINELKIAYNSLKDNIDVVTITGSGEPTLNKDIEIIVQRVKELINHPLVLLTNSTLLTDDEVKKGVLNFDIIVPSIDAVSEEIFYKVNRPHKKLNLKEILEHLKSFSYTFTGELNIEVLIVKGVNDGYDELKKIASYIKDLKYNKVQINTVFRPPAYPDAVRLSDSELLEIAIFFKKEGIRVEPVKNFMKNLKIEDNNYHTYIKSILEMRPCTAKDLSSIFDLTEDELMENIKRLNNVISYKHNNE
ncbi:MAG: radical SAM protein, partial [Deferribacterales bacterium]